MVKLCSFTRVLASVSSTSDELFPPAKHMLQPAESIALLVAFLKSGMPKDQILLYLSVFSAMGPIGVGVGMAVNEFAAPIVDSIMVAVVAGTFVYVGATEVIPEEWEDSEHKWKKFAALMAGIISILAITQYTATLEL